MDSLKLVETGYMEEPCKSELGIIEVILNEANCLLRPSHVISEGFTDVALGPDIVED